MSPNVIFFAWNRSMPGREPMSAEHFGDFTGYLEGLKKGGLVESYDTVFLNPHGGDLNGFFLIRGEGSKLDALQATEEWQKHMLRANMHLQGSGNVRGHTGDMVLQMFELWSSLIPAS